MGYIKSAALEETGYVVLDRYNKEIDPKEWLDVEYVDWKSSGDTRFAPLASAKGEIELNKGLPTVTLKVANSGDRPIQVGSHYHFYETNQGLKFDRELARGMRLDIAAGTAMRFEPGQERDVTLVPLGGGREAYGFQRKVMGKL